MKRIYLLFLSLFLFYDVSAQFTISAGGVARYVIDATDDGEITRAWVPGAAGEIGGTWDFGPAHNEISIFANYQTGQEESFNGGISIMLNLPGSGGTDVEWVKWLSGVMFYYNGYVDAFEMSLQTKLKLYPVPRKFFIELGCGVDLVETFYYEAAPLLYSKVGYRF